MYNIFLLSKCNLRCGYCFAEGYMGGYPGKTRVKGNTDKMMEGNDYDWILKFLKESAVTVVSLLGGEPTLHPDFSTFVKMALGRSFLVSIKSNATWREQVLKEICLFPTEGIHFLLNINPPMALGTHLWQKVVDNVHQIKGRDVDLQLNIDRVDFEYSYLLDLAKEARPHKIVWSLSNMVKGEGNDSLADPVAVREKYSKRILAFVGDAGKEGIQTVGVHGITPCMFSERDYQTLLANGGRLESTCRPVFDILPDLSVLFCFPMGEYFGRKYLYNYQNLQELNMEFMEGLTFQRSDSYPLEKCFDCLFLRSQTCHGGCLARHLDRRLSPVLGEDRFFERIPFRTETFRVDQKSADCTSEPTSDAILVDEQSGEQYPINQPLSALLEAVDGQSSLGSIYRLIFGKYEESRMAQKIFQEVITQLLKRGVLAVKPFKKTGAPVSQPPSKP